MLSLQLQKSPTPDFEEKCGNSPDISKGISQLGIYKFESSEVSQPARRLETLPFVPSEMPANGGLLRIGYRSPGSEIGRCGTQIADSLRRIFGIFPFLGDSDRRPSSIGTAWAVAQGETIGSDAGADRHRRFDHHPGQRNVFKPESLPDQRSAVVSDFGGASCHVGAHPLERASGWKGCRNP